MSIKKLQFRKVQEGTASEHEDCYGTFKKLEFSKSVNFKKLSVLAQILSFLQKNMCCQNSLEQQKNSSRNF